VRDKEQADSFAEVSGIVADVSGEVNGHLRGTCTGLPCPADTHSLTHQTH
jgi:hypothetical protein